MLRVPLFDDESLTSYCARLAAANMTTATDFCRDMGIRFQEVIDGSDAAIAALAEYGGIQHIRLRNAAVYLRPHSEYLVGTEVFPRMGYSRMRIRFCPACFRADDRASDRMPGVRRYMRQSWPLRFLRTCPVHDCQIADLGLSPLHNPRLHDFMENLDVLDEAVYDAMSLVSERQASPFEHYLVDRLQGRKNHGSLLNGLPLFQGAYLCEVTGSVAVFGHSVRERQLDEANLFIACQEGFSYLREGYTGLEHFLDMMHGRAQLSRHLTGGRKLYGRLYSVLQQSRDPSWDGIKATIRNYAFARLPLPKSADIFGNRDDSDYVSDSGIEEMTDIPPAQVRKLAVAAGLLAPSMISSVAISKAVVSELLELSSDWMLPAEAAALLGVTYSNFQNFIAADLFRPVLTSQNGASVHDRYSRREIVGYLESVRSMAIFCEHVGLVPLEVAARRVACRIVDASEAIRMGRLKRVGVEKSRSGLTAFMVDPHEVSQIFSVRDHDLLAPPALMKLWKMRLPTIYALQQCNAVPTVTQAVRTKMVHTFVKRDDAMAFIEKHIALSSAPREFGASRVRVKEAVRRAGLVPVFSFEDLQAYIFDREALSLAIADIAHIHLPQESASAKSLIRRKQADKREVATLKA